MLELIHGVPARIASLKAKLAAREGKSEYAENVKHIKAEITRLEGLSQRTADLEEFVASETAAPVASPGDGVQ